MQSVAGAICRWSRRIISHAAGYDVDDMVGVHPVHATDNYLALEAETVATRCASPNKDDMTITGPTVLQQRFCRLLTL